MSDSERAALGRERVGEPIAEVVQAFVPAFMGSELAGMVEPQAVMEYVNGFLFAAFVQLIDESTGGIDALEAIQPAGVQQAVLLLLRDVLARELVVRNIPADEAAEQIHDFIEKLAHDLGAEPAPVLEPELPLDTDDLEADWASEAMEAIGLTRRHGLMLVVAHAAFVDDAWEK